MRRGRAGWHPLITAAVMTAAVLSAGADMAAAAGTGTGTRVELCQFGRGQAASDCPPPATMQQTGVPAPFNALVRYAGTEQVNGATYWIWAKVEGAGPETECSAAERAWYGRWCDVRAGDVLYRTQAFVRVEE